MCETKCANSSCGKYIGGTVIYADVFCNKCKHYTIVRPEKENKAIIRMLYTPDKNTKQITKAFSLVIKNQKVTYTNSSQ